MTTLLCLPQEAKEIWTSSPTCTSCSFSPILFFIKSGSGGEQLSVYGQPIVAYDRNPCKIFSSQQLCKASSSTLRTQRPHLMITIEYSMPYTMLHSSIFNQLLRGKVDDPPPCEISYEGFIAWHGNKVNTGRWFEGRVNYLWSKKIKLTSESVTLTSHSKNILLHVRAFNDV